jgi:hypothetical protein
VRHDLPEIELLLSAAFRCLDDGRDIDHMKE